MNTISSPEVSLHNYLTVTLGYWAFTLTDGAIRMLVVLYFYQLGYSPLEIAALFLFYEFFGILTNLIGGWLGSRIGLNLTMHIGMGLQVVALVMLTVDHSWLSVPYVMLAQALSGIAKDLNKMSAKASVKLMLPQHEDQETRLFRWVAILTGSKNSLKGAGFFLGAFLLSVAGFQGALWILASGLFMILIITWILLPGEIGKAKSKPKFSRIFSKSSAVNWLSAARFFLFGSRDIWFVVALPVFLHTTGWSHTQVGTFMALWVIGYGIVQALSPRLLKSTSANGSTARTAAFMLSLIPAAMALALSYSLDGEWVVILGLAIFGVVFAVNSALHSYLIVSWSDLEKVSMNVGFYYMSNAAGRLVGTVISGGAYQLWGLKGCLWWSFIFLVITWILSFRLPETINKNPQPI